MRRIPRHVVRVAHRASAGPDDYALLLEWRLTSDDVALLMGVTRMTVWNWANRGYRGYKLRFRKFSRLTGRGTALTFRIVDLEEFASQINRGIDYSLLHPALQREWGVGIFGPSNTDPAEHDTLGTLTNREEHHHGADHPDQNPE